MSEKIRKQTKRWKVADGRRVRICDMPTGHLLNAIKYCFKRRRQILWIAKIIAKYGTDYVEESIGISYFHSCGKAMLKDAARRGIVINEKEETINGTFSPEIRYHADKYIEKLHWRIQTLEGENRKLKKLKLSNPTPEG